MVRPAAIRNAQLPGLVRLAKALPRHESEEFVLPRDGFLRKLNRLMNELDDDCEFVRLETSGRSLVLTIRHR